MTIEKKQEGTSLTVALGGRLDTTTAPQLEQELELVGITDRTLDMNDLDYISSAGLRVILKAQKQMDTQGTMKLTRVNDIVKEIFEVTGFSDFITFA